MKPLLQGRPALLMSSLAFAATLPLMGSALAMPDYSASASAILTVESVSGPSGVVITDESSITERSFDDGAIVDIIAFPEGATPLGEGDALTLFLSVSGEASGDDDVSAVLAAPGTLAVEPASLGMVVAALVVPVAVRRRRSARIPTG